MPLRSKAPEWLERAVRGREYLRHYVGASEASRCISPAASLFVLLFEALQLEVNKDKGGERMRERARRRKENAGGSVHRRRT